MRTTRNPSILFIVISLIISPFLIPSRAAAEDVGLLLRFEDGVQAAPLLGTFVHIEVTGILARATVTQSFTNPTDKHVEAVYVFPLPEKAAVDALRMTVGERRIEGEIHAAAEAAEIYREASAEGRKAALLESQRPNVFTARVTQIGPGETVEIEIGMQLEVDYDLGTFRLRFPLVVAPRYAPGRLLQVSPLDPPGGCCSRPSPPARSTRRRCASTWRRAFRWPGSPAATMRSTSSTERGTASRSSWPTRSSPPTATSSSSGRPSPGGRRAP